MLPARVSSVEGLAERIGAVGDGPGGEREAVADVPLQIRADGRARDEVDALVDALHLADVGVEGLALGWGEDDREVGDHQAGRGERAMEEG